MRKRREREEGVEAAWSNGASDSRPPTIGLAMEHHKAGRLPQAENILRQILGAEPDNPVVLHLLGVIAHQFGKHAAALQLMAKALALRPDYVEAHNNLGNILRDMGRLEDAVDSFGKALALDPDNAALHYNAGNTLKAMGRLEDAVASYRKALAINPDFTEVHTNLGNTLVRLERREEALAEFHRVLELDPSNSAVGHMVAALTGETTEAAPREYVLKLFDDYSAEFDDHLVAGLAYDVPARMRQATDRITNVTETFPRALDLGCGTGLVAQCFRDIVGQIDGVDLSPRMLARAKEKDVYAALFQEDVLEFLERRDRVAPGYDLVLAADLFIYIGALGPIFAAIGDVLTAGGRFVFSVENLDQGSYKLRQTGRYCQSESYIRELASHCGFSIELRQSIDIRKGKHAPVTGNIFILRKNHR